MQPTLRAPSLRLRIAVNVRLLRYRRGLRLEDAEERSGLNWRHWQKVEGGEVNLTLQTLERLALTLGVDEADLLRKPTEEEVEQARARKGQQAARRVRAGQAAGRVSNTARSRRA